MADYQAFLLKLTDNLNLLREREAKYGGNAPLELVNQIDDHRQAISLTEQAIRGELSESEWREALQPLLIAVQTRTGDAASGVTLSDIGGSIQHSTIAGRDVNQITVNVVNLLGQAMKQQNQELEPTAQAIVDLTMAQVKAKEPGIAQRYPQNPAGYGIPLQDTLTELLQADRGLAARLDALLTRYEQAAKERPASGGTSYKATVKGSGAIAQGSGAQAAGAGGVNVGGNVGGHVITGSKNTVVGGDYVRGDKVGGDKVDRDKTTVVTRGGAYVKGNVNTGGGDFVGRDQTNSEVHQNPQIFIHVGDRVKKSPKTRRTTLSTPRLIQEAIRLDVASPARVIVGHTFPIGIAVLLPDSPPLQIEDLPQVFSEEGEIFRLEDTEIINYRVEIEAPDFEPSRTEYVFRLKKNEDSKVKYFLICAKKQGKLPILINAYQEHYNVASNRITIEAFVEVVSHAQMFQVIYQQIEARPADLNMYEEVTETVQKIEREVKKGEEADPSKVERWLKLLNYMAPDIGDVTIACLVNPAAGVAMVIKKIAEKAQAEAGKAS